MDGKSTAGHRPSSAASLSLLPVLFDDGIELLRCRLGPEFGRREDGVLDGGAAAAGAPGGGEPPDGFAHDDLRVADVLVEVLDHGLDRDGVVRLVPAVVVGDERQRRVADFGLARQLRLLQVRHPDDVHPPRAVDVRLGLRREGRPLHAQVGAAAVDVHLRHAAGLLQHVAHIMTDRVRERDVADDALAEEGRFVRARAGAVEELVGDDHVERRVLLLERADGRGRKYPLDAEQLHGVDVGAEGQLGRQVLVPAAVARQEGHALAFERADDEGVRRRAEWRLDRHLLHVLQLRHLVEAAAPDDPYLRCRHFFSPAPNRSRILSALSLVSSWFLPSIFRLSHMALKSATARFSGSGSLPSVSSVTPSWTHLLSTRPKRARFTCGLPRTVSFEATVRQSPPWKASLSMTKSGCNGGWW